MFAERSHEHLDFSEYVPDQWGALFAWFSQFTAFELALGLLPVTAFYLLVSYLLLRRAVA